MRLRFGNKHVTIKKISQIHFLAITLREVNYYCHFVAVSAEGDSADTLKDHSRNCWYNSKMPFFRFAKFDPTDHQIIFCLSNLSTIALFSVT